MLTVTKWLVIGLLALFVTPAMAIGVCNQTNLEVKVAGYAPQSITAAWKPNLASGACKSNSNLAGKTTTYKVVAYYNCNLTADLHFTTVFYLKGNATLHLNGQCKNGGPPGECQCGPGSTFTFTVSTQK